MSTEKGRQHDKVGSFIMSTLLPRIIRLNSSERQEAKGMKGVEINAHAPRFSSRPCEQTMPRKIESDCPNEGIGPSKLGENDPRLSRHDIRRSQTR